MYPHPPIFSSSIYFYLKSKERVPVVAHWKRIQLGTMRLQVRSLALLSGLKIRCCHELWCRSQTRLGSWVAVALAQTDNYSSDLTPSLGTSICHVCGPRKDRGKTLAKFSLYYKDTVIKIQWCWGSSHFGSVIMNLTSIHEDTSLALLRGLKIRCCHELWCTSQAWL